MAKQKNSVEDLLGEPKKVKVVKPVAKNVKEDVLGALSKGKPSGKNLKKDVAKAISKAISTVKLVEKKPRAKTSAIEDSDKLKATSKQPREGTMFAQVAKAFGAGTTVKTAVERLKKTLVQPRGKSAGKNQDSFVRGYVRGALAAGVLAKA